MYRCLVAAVVCLIALVVQGIAQAAPPALPHGSHFVIQALGPHVHDGYFVFTAKPGSRIAGAVRLSNRGDAAGTTDVYSVDAATGRTSGAVYLTNRKPVGYGRWMHLHKTHVSLPAGGTAVVAFTIRVPRSAHPGQYDAGVFVNTSSQTVRAQRAQAPTKHQAAAVVHVRTVEGVAYLVDVPGKRAPHFTVSHVYAGSEGATQYLYLRLRNSGNALAKPTGSITISSVNGARREPISFAMDTFLPHTQIDYPVALDQALLPGDYTAAVEIDYAGMKALETLPVHVSQKVIDKIVSRTHTTEGLPQPAPPVAAKSGVSMTLLYLLGGAVLVLLAAVAAMFVRLRRR